MFASASNTSSTTPPQTDTLFILVVVFLLCKFVKVVRWSKLLDLSKTAVCVVTGFYKTATNTKVSLFLAREAILGESQFVVHEGSTFIS